MLSPFRHIGVRGRRATTSSVSLAVVAGVGAILLGVPVALAEDTPDRRLAISLAREGRCEPALEVFARVQTSPPTDPEIARLEGACALRLQDFRRAIAALEAARALDPEDGDVDLQLAMAYYHAGRIDDARDAIDLAAARSPDRAEVLLYAGLVAYAEEDFDAAAGRLDAASRLSDAPVEPMASFFLGRARQGAAQDDRAREAFERVVREHPGTPWADEAERALAEIEAGPFAWWLTAELGYEFDDNALLRGRTVSLPEDVSRESDHRGFWFADLGATLFEVAGFVGGATLRYAGSEHAELDQFDTHAPGATLWVDRALDAGGTALLDGASLRLQYDFDTAFIDFKDDNRDPFVTSHLVGASFYKPWEDGAWTLIGATVGIDDYGYARPNTPDNDLPGGTNTACPVPLPTCSPPGINEVDRADRDGVGVGASLRHHLTLPIEVAGLDRPWGEAGYRYVRYWSEGTEYDQQRHEVELSVGIALPFALALRATGRYAYAPYGNPTVFPDPGDVNPAQEYFLSTRDREEHETYARVSLERPIGESTVVTARYSRTRNRSNADVFDYDRHLFGLSVRVGLGGP